MASDDWPAWLPADWTVQFIKVEQRKVKYYVDPQGHKCYSKPQVFEYLRKMGKSLANENTDNGDGSTVDLSLDPNIPNTNEIPESSPGGQLRKLTPRTSRRKSKPTGGSSSVDGSPPEPLSSQRYNEDSSWLPDGWTVEVKTRQSGTSCGMKFKCYTDPISGHKFFSKPDVLNHLAKTNRSVGGQKEVPTDPISPTPISTWEIEGTLAGNGSPSLPLSSQRKDGNSSWLPEGWTVEVKARKGGSSGGMKYKLYTDPISGQKFFSKPQVLNHLVKINGSASGQKEGFTEPIIASPISSWRDNSTTEVDKSQIFEATEVKKNNNEKKTESARLSSDYEVISRTPVEGLPPGWIKELRLRKRGVVKKTHPYYLDPLSEYVFFSKKDALRYLDSGNIKSCVIKPLKRDMNKDSHNMILTGGEMDLPSDPSKQTETSKELPNDTVTELNTNGSVIELKTNGSGIENPKPIRSITGGNFSTPNDPRKEVISRTPVEGLPPGWIKELRLRKRAVAKKTDLYYLDPLSEYVFFSKKDALRYLDSGNIKSCVIKPLKRDMNKDSHNMTLTGGEMDLPSDPSKQTETSKELPNDTVTELNTNGSVIELKTNGSGIENPKPIRSITGGNFSTPNDPRKEVRSISGGTFSSPKEKLSEWLPDGWVVEVHYKASRMKYKIFKETATGKKLYSKPQVLNYLNGSSSNSRKRKEINSSGAPDSSQNINSADGSRPKRSIKKKGNIEKNSNYEEVITTCPADGLPPGWIKELRTKIYATHKRNDPFYIDPVTGYIFRSKLDALRFFDTGDINLCVMRPKIKDKDGNEVYVYTNAVSKPADTTNGKQHFEEGEDTMEKQQNAEDPKTADISPTRGTRMSNRIIKRNDSPTALPARSSKRQKGVNPGTEDNIAIEEKQGSGVKLEQQPDDDGHLSYDIPEDDNWTDQCIDWEVKTLTNEILFNGQPTSSAEAAFPEEGAAADAGVSPTGENETPTKVN